MEKKKEKKTEKRKIEERFLVTTDTLDENEVQANMFLARILLYSAGIAILFIILNATGNLDADKRMVYMVMIQILAVSLAGAGICYYKKGRDPYLKGFLLAIYVYIFACCESILGYSAYLVMCFAVVVSTRYYSRIITMITAVATTIAAFVSDFLCNRYMLGYIDLNYASVNGNEITGFNGRLRDIVTYAIYDPVTSWREFFFRGFLPKLGLYLMIVGICIRLAENGRKTILAQRDETKRNERISTELNLASSIQADMLPNIFPPFPDRQDFDIYASMTPAKEVGGDFYDFYMTDEDHLAMVIADVSGKGIPAALFMVIAKTLIKDQTLLGLTPSMVFTMVNNMLCEGNKAGLFVTAWMGILDISTGEFAYANAGHNPPVLVKNGKTFYLHSKPGFVLAGMEGVQYEEFYMNLEQGDKIFLYTDGVTESCNEKKELYGEERLLHCIREIPDDASCAEVVHRVRADVDAFVGKAEQSDDLTMLAFDYTSKDSVRSSQVVERTFDAKVENLHDVLSFVEEGMETHGADMKAMMTVSVAMEEIFVNICHYAYPEHAGKAIVGMRFHDDRIDLYLVDYGIPFDPLSKEDPDVTLSLEEREVGGLGIYMVKQSMDECSYERKGNQNRFYMSRRLRG